MDDKFFLYILLSLSLIFFIVFSLQHPFIKNTTEDCIYIKTGNLTLSKYNPDTKQVTRINTNESVYKEVCK